MTAFELALLVCVGLTSPSCDWRPTGMVYRTADDCRTVGRLRIGEGIIDFRCEDRLVTE